tara:strand:+ start:582 stop:950 length:369 start_codon:yes stop_codon:yes gene_type:complete
MSVISKRKKWQDKKSRISYKVNNVLKVPKVIIFRSNKNISVQLIDNKSNSTICSSSSLDKDISSLISKGKNKTDISKIVAENMSKKLKSKKIDKIVFDRSGYRFHGRVKVIADTLKENGISI